MSATGRSGHSPDEGGLEPGGRMGCWNSCITAVMLVVVTRLPLNVGSDAT
jgi:hypothetical protein